MISNVDMTVIIATLKADDVFSCLPSTYSFLFSLSFISIYQYSASGPLIEREPVPFSFYNAMFVITTNFLTFLFAVEYKSH